MSKKIHVCLVSQQPIPNLIPLKMDILMPQRVVLLVSRDMDVQAKRLEDVIRSFGMKVEKRDIEPYKHKEARDVVLNVLADFEAEDIWLNVTGGTKIMAFAAFEVFYANKKPIIYVDTQNRVIHKLSPEDDEYKFEDVIGINTYLRVYGQEIKDYERTSICRKRIEAGRKIIKGYNRFENAIGSVNRYVAPLRDDQRLESDEIDKITSAFKDLIEVFRESGCSIELRDNRLFFEKVEDIEFVSGGWLEEYVYSTVSSIGVKEVRRNVKVVLDERGNKPPRNEYDVLFIHNNRLFMIECKTGRLEGSDREAHTTEIIYKIDSLIEHAGGIYGKAMFISYRKIPLHAKERLKANNIECCDGASLKELRRIIKEWIKKT